MKFDFKNKKVLITGASGGIGKTLSKKFIEMQSTIISESKRSFGMSYPLTYLKAMFVLVGCGVCRRQQGFAHYQLLWKADSELVGRNGSRVPHVLLA